MYIIVITANCGHAILKQCAYIHHSPRTPFPTYTPVQYINAHVNHQPCTTSPMYTEQPSLVALMYTDSMNGSNHVHYHQ